MIKNSSKIISAIGDNYEKFATIEKLYSDYIKVRKEKIVFLKELQKRCSILRDISGRRIHIGKIQSSIWNYFISPSGITKSNIPSDSYKELGNEPNLEINEELYEISNIMNIKKHIKKREAKTKFEKFFKYRNLLKNEPDTIIDMKKIMCIKTSSSMQPWVMKNVKTIKMKFEDNRRGVLEFYSELGRLEMTINLDYSEGIKDKIYIEQMYCQISKLLTYQLKAKHKEVEKIKLFLAKLKEELPEYFMIEAIENANEKN